MLFSQLVYLFDDNLQSEQVEVQKDSKTAGRADGQHAENNTETAAGYYLLFRQRSAVKRSGAGRGQQGVRASERESCVRFLCALLLS